MLRTLMTIVLLICVGGFTDSQTTAIPATPPPNGDLCWNRAEAAQPLSTFEDFIASVPRSDGFFQSLRAANLPRIGHGVYQAEVGDMVRVRYQLYSIDPAQTYQIFFMVNEQPLLIGEDDTAYVNVALSPEEPMHTVEFDVPLSEAGIYDVVVAVPNNSAQFMAVLPSHTNGNRITVVASRPDLASFSFDRIDTISLASVPYLFPELGVTLPEDTEYWTLDDTVTLREGEVLSFDILRGYVNRNNNANAPDLPHAAVDRFALMAFIDGEPIALNGSAVIYGEVPEDTLARIPVEVTELLDIGDHELVVISIPHPRVPVCVLNGPSDGYFFLVNPQITRLPFTVEP